MLCLMLLGRMNHDVRIQKINKKTATQPARRPVSQTAGQTASQTARQPARQPARHKLMHYSFILEPASVFNFSGVGGGRVRFF